MTPNAITLLFKEARDSFPPIEEKPTDDDLLLIRETLLPILMEIPYDQLGGIPSLTAILTDTVTYAANHGSNAFKRPVQLPLYDGSIADNATTVVRILAEAAHKARLDDYASYKAAEHGASKFPRETVNEVWFKDTVANLALTSTVSTLTATNKKLLDAATHRGGNPAATPGATPAATPARGRRPPKTPHPPHPGNYCWTHGHRNCREHTSATCFPKAPGQRNEATAANTLGGSEKNKGWEAKPT